MSYRIADYFPSQCTGETARNVTCDQRFREYIDDANLPCVRGQRGVHEATHQHNRDVGVDHPQRLRELRTRHVGHRFVRQHGMEALRRCAEPLERSDARRKTHRLVAELGDGLLTQPPWSSTLASSRCHVDKLPDMSIEVLKAILIHEPKVLEWRMDRSTARHRIADHLIYLLSTLARQADQHLRAFAGCERIDEVKLERHFVRSDGRDDFHAALAYVLVPFPGVGRAFARRGGAETSLHGAVFFLPSS